MFAFLFVLSILFMRLMYSASKSSRINQDGLYEEYVRDRRESRRRARSRRREEEKKKNNDPLSNEELF